MRFSPALSIVGAVLLLLTANVSAFWRMPCLSRSGLARIDPLVSFGTVSEHAHAIHGSSGFSETATHSDLVAGECTSCQVAQDKSAYWTPALYFQDSGTNQFELVQQQGGMLAYYLLYPNSNDPTNHVNAFPAGFQMIAGDTNQRNFSYPVPDIPKSNWNVAPYNTQAFLRQAALGFNCLNYAIAPEGSLFRHFLPDKAYLDANCADGVRFELMFPSCWNGSLDSADHKSHVAYPSEVMTGDCPPEYPQRLVSMFYETIWNTQKFVGRSGQFVLANGDPTGYGYHGDFIMGWDPAFLQSAVNTCTNPSGEIQDCSLFDIQDSSVYSNCNISTPAVLTSENVVSPNGQLPGNPAIVSGPGYASGAEAGTSRAPSGSSAAAVPTLSHSDGQILASSDTYVPGAVFAVSTSTSSTPTPSIASTQPTSSPAPTTIASTAAAQSESYFSTQYLTSGQTVSEILWVEETVTITEGGVAKRGHGHAYKHVRH